MSTKKDLAEKEPEQVQNEVNYHEAKDFVASRKLKA